MRRARARRLATVAAVSVSQAARWRSRPQVVTSWWVVKARSRPRSGSGAATVAVARKLLARSFQLLTELQATTGEGQPAGCARPITCA
jgi:hypothetical protein